MGKTQAVGANTKGYWRSRFGSFGGGPKSEPLRERVEEGAVCAAGRRRDAASLWVFAVTLIVVWVSVVAMGIEKQVLRPGNGPRPFPGQSVTVHCTGYGKNGDLSQKFWSTKDPGQSPFTFKIGQGSVIKGWDEGVLGMQVGEVARLQCSPDYAYGANGFPAWGIRPNSVLVFEIEVLSAK